MLSRTLYAALAAAALRALPLAAQDTTAARKPAPDTTRVPAAAPAAEAAAPTGEAVAPGMSEADVRTRWGNPIAVRSANTWTYLFYRNHREREVGYYDVVFLHGGKVVDAIVRSPDHVYAGESSSPEGGRVPADTTQGATVTGVRVQPGP